MSPERHHHHHAGPHQFAKQHATEKGRKVQCKVCAGGDARRASQHNQLASVTGWGLPSRKVRILSLSHLIPKIKKKFFMWNGTEEEQAVSRV